MEQIKKRASLTDGPVFTRMLLFVIPIMLTGFLQVAYNISDNIIAGRYSGDPTALAAIGSTGALTGLVTSFIIGISSGSGVVIAHFFGAREEGEVSKTLHTSMAFSVIGGIGFMIVGLVISEPALILMKTKPDVIDNAVLYMRTICFGIPGMSIMNFGAAAVRSVGNSRLPLYVFSISGLINVGLNVFFVLVCGMSVFGVALATIISQYLAAAAIVAYLLTRHGKCYKLDIKKIKIEKRLLMRILRLGLPAGIQSSLFSISNVFVMTAFNNFETTTITARTISANIESLLYTVLNSYMQASMIFIGQNYGAKKNRRLNKVFISSVSQVLIFGVIFSVLVMLLKTPLSWLFIDPLEENKALIFETIGKIFGIMMPFYWVCGLMDNLAGILRGFGYPIMSMTSSLIGLAVRVGWIFFVFPLERFKTIEGVSICYPISWCITAVLSFAFCAYVWHKLGIWKNAKLEKEKENNLKEKEICVL